MKPRCSKQILPVPWPFIISRFHCTLVIPKKVGVQGRDSIRVGEGRARRLAYADKALRNGASLQLAYAAGTLVCFFGFWLHKDYYF